MNAKLFAIPLLICSTVVANTATIANSQSYVDPRVRDHVNSMLILLQMHEHNLGPMCSLDKVSCLTQKQILCQTATVFTAKVTEYIFARLLPNNDPAAEEIRRGRRYCNV
jgi:hypothetical protein